MVLLEGVADLLLALFVEVLETVFLGLTVLASFFAPTEAERLADVDLLLVVDFLVATAAFLDFADVALVVFFLSLEAAFFVTDAERDLVVLRLAGDFEVAAGDFDAPAVFLLDDLVALLLRRSVFFSVDVDASTGATSVLSSDFLFPFDDLQP